MLAGDPASFPRRRTARACGDAESHPRRARGFRTGTARRSGLLRENTTRVEAYGHFRLRQVQGDFECGVHGGNALWRQVAHLLDEPFCAYGPHLLGQRDRILPEAAFPSLQDHVTREDSGLMRSVRQRNNNDDGTVLVDGIPADEDRKSTRLNSSHIQKSRMPSSA